MVEGDEDDKLMEDISFSLFVERNQEKPLSQNPETG